MTTVIQSKLETIGWKIAILMTILRRIAVGTTHESPDWVGHPGSSLYALWSAVST